MSASTILVLTTYELLESILLNLPIHDLFRFRQISKTWLSIISRSVPVQEAMYLTPSGTPLKAVDSTYNYYSGRTRALYQPVPVQLNPCAEVAGLINQPAGRGHRIPLATFGLSDQNLFLQFEIKGIPVYEAKDLHSTASWRDMLLTQPPVTAVNFEFIRRDPHGGSVTVFNLNGVTFGELHDMSLKMARDFEVATGEDSELSFESMSFCLFHPFTTDEMEEAW